MENSVNRFTSLKPCVVSHLCLISDKGYSVLLGFILRTFRSGKVIMQSYWVSVHDVAF